MTKADDAADTQSCGEGVAQHAEIPATIAVMLDALAETLELHRRMLLLDDAHARAEDDVYRELAETWSRIAKLVESAAARMEAQKSLPMGAHDESAWGNEHLSAFDRFVTAEKRLLALLQIAAARDENMLQSMKSPR